MSQLKMKPISVTQPSVNWNRLPEELWRHILLITDDSALLTLESTSHMFKFYLKAMKIYEIKCRRLLNRNTFWNSTFKYFMFERECGSYSWCKEFYFRLRRLQHFSWGSKNAQVMCRNMLKELNLTDSDRNIAYDTSGIYNSVWIEESGILVSNVRGNIEVWDMDLYTIIHIFRKSDLKEENSTTTCFHANKNILAVGTSWGRVKLFNLRTGNLLYSNRVGYYHICDIRILDSTLVAINNLGVVFECKINYDESNFSLVSEITQPIEEAYDEDTPPSVPIVNFSRSIEISDKFIACTNDKFVIVFDRRTCSKTITAIHCENKIASCKLFNDKVIWGGIKGAILCAPIKENEVNVFDQTSYTFPQVTTLAGEDITSVCMNDYRIIVGDIRGHLFVCSHDHFKNAAKRDRLRAIFSSREKKTTCIWSVKMDGFRIFSEDSSSTLVVHDYCAPHIVN